jgi:hypothetical protein
MAIQKENAKAVNMELSLIIFQISSKPLSKRPLKS